MRWSLRVCRLCAEQLDDQLGCRDAILRVDQHHHVRIVVVLNVLVARLQNLSYRLGAQRQQACEVMACAYQVVVGLLGNRSIDLGILVAPSVDCGDVNAELCGDALPVLTEHSKRYDASMPRIEIVRFRAFQCVRGHTIAFRLLGHRSAWETCHVFCVLESVPAIPLAPHQAGSFDAEPAGSFCGSA